MLYLQSPKGGCCSISDDLSCCCKVRTIVTLIPVEQGMYRLKLRHLSHIVKRVKTLISITYILC